MGIAAAIMTAFYSWRFIIMTFHGKPRASKEVMSHVHESPKVMIMPLMVLATGAIVSGYAFMVDLSAVEHHGDYGAEVHADNNHYGEAANHAKEETHSGDANGYNLLGQRTFLGG